MKQIKKDYLIAADGEFSGLDYCSAQLISFGAIFLDENLNSLHKEEWLINYKPEEYSWCDEAEEVHKISKENALTHGVEPEVFLNDFEQKIIKTYGTEAVGNIKIIASNAYNDLIFLKKLWEKYKKEDFICSYRTVDISSIGTLISENCDSTYSLVDFFNIELTDDKKRHTALYDAEVHLKIYKCLKEHFAKNLI